MCEACGSGEEKGRERERGEESHWFVIAAVAVVVAGCIGAGRLILSEKLDLGCELIDCEVMGEYDLYYNLISWC